MRALFVAAILFFINTPVAAEQFVEHGGRKIVGFDVPLVQYRGNKVGTTTRMFFSAPVKDGNLKITVRVKGWLSELKAEQRYQDDKRVKRRDQNSRLQEPIELAGTLKTLTYSMSTPYKAQAIILYTKDFRCEFLVTGTKQADEMIEPVYQQLLKTLRIVPRTKIGELKVGE